VRLSLHAETDTVRSHALRLLWQREGGADGDGPRCCAVSAKSNAPTHLRQRRREDGLVEASDLIPAVDGLALSALLLERVRQRRHIVEAHDGDRERPQLLCERQRQEVRRNVARELELVNEPARRAGAAFSTAFGWA